MKRIHYLLPTVLILVAFSSYLFAQTADPVRYTMRTTSSIVSLGEEIEIIIKAECLDFPSNTVFVFEDSYHLQLKIIIPDGFKQTGGTFSQNMEINLSPGNRQVTYSLKGKFVDPSNATEFLLLKKNQNTGQQTPYVAVSRLKYLAKNFESEMKEAREESISMMLAPNQYIPYMTMGDFRQTSDTTMSLFYLNEGKKSGYFGLSPSEPLPDDSATVLVANGRKFVRKIDSNDPNLVFYFGARVDGISNDAPALRKAINYAISRNGGILKLPPGKIAVNDTSGFLITYPIKIIGSGWATRHYRDTGLNYATVLIDRTPGFVQKSLFQIDGSNTSLYNSMPSVQIENLMIMGTGQDRDAIYLNQVGWDMTINNLSIDYFNGAAITFDRQYDSNITNLTISRCGKMIGGAPRYALNFITSQNQDTNNAIHFANIHMEFCRYYVNFERARHVYFLNSKFEVFSSTSQPTMNGVDSDLANPHFRFGNFAWELGFVGCMFVSRMTDEWLAANPGATIHQLPYTFQSTANSTANMINRSVRFSNCDFTSPNIGTKGVKLIDAGLYSSFTFDGCYFDNLSGYTTAMKLNKTKLSDSKTINVLASDSAYSAISLAESELSNSNITVTGSINTNRLSVIELSGPLNVVSNTRISGAYTHYKQSTSAANGSIFDRMVKDITLTDATYMAMMGVSTIDFSNVVIDLAKIDCSIIKLKLSQDATIKTIRNGFKGESIVFYCDDQARIFKFLTGGESNNNIIDPRILGPGQFVTFLFSGFNYSQPQNTNEGTYAANANGTDKFILIPHGLPYTPTYFSVTPTALASAGYTYITANASSIVVNYGSVPASCTGCMMFNFSAKR
jgi:hypothetical protein